MTQEIIDDDMLAMCNMLKSINDKFKNHLNKKEVYEFMKPLKYIIYEAWADACTEGMPTFSNKTAQDILKEYYGLAPSGKEHINN